MTPSHVQPTPAERKDNGKSDELELAIQRFKNRTEAEMLADRARILAACPAPRPLPEGKTLDDVFAGILKDNMTDEEVIAALAELS
jgi:hypothetical protein